MAGKFTSLVPISLGVLILILVAFGGLSYEFYAFGSTWAGLGFFASLFIAFAALINLTRNFFTKHTGRMIFALFLIAIMGAYFAFLIYAKDEKGWRVNKYPMGIDLAGGTELIYVLDYSQIERNIERTQKLVADMRQKDPEKAKTLSMQLQTMEESMKTAPDKAAEVVRKRVDPTGTKGVPVTTYGANHERLRIQLPRASMEEVNRIKKAIQTQGRLAFHIVAKKQETIEAAKRSPTKITTEDGVDWEVRTIEKPKIITTGFTSEEIVMKRMPEMDGSHVTLALSKASTEGAGYEIEVRFDPAGSVEFAQLTGKNVGSKMAIVLDNVIYSAPEIKERIEGTCRISGNFDKTEAEKLAGVLTAGSLPAEVKLLSDLTVGPSLGQEQIVSGARATVIATAAVIVFMIFYYRLAGGIAAFCMLLNLPMLLGLMGFFKATLTLPGIAGIVLTLGMAVDANVLIIERLREELQRGRPLRLAVSHGFERAFLTIIDCHMTTLLSSIVLYYLGSGPVRGFAVSLSLGILTTLFCNLWLNWILTEWLVSRDAILGLNLMQFFKTTHIDFMGSRRLWMTITGGLAVASLVLVGVFTMNKTLADRIYDVDFTGGTRIQFNFAKGKAQTVEKVRHAVDTDVRAGVEKRVAAVKAALVSASANADKQLAELTKAGSPATPSGVSGAANATISKEVADKVDASLRPELLKLPNGEVVAKDAAGRSESLLEGLKLIIKDVEKAQSDVKDGSLVIQSSGAAAGVNTYLSFTLTTQLNSPVVIDELNTELKERFKNELEPEAVVADAATKTITLRLDDPALSKDEVDSRVKTALLESAKDIGNSDIKDALVAVAVGKTEASEGYLQAELSSLPTDAKAFDRVVQAVQLAKIPGRIGGPIASTNGFGSQVAGEMKWQALGALIIANLAVFIYLWFRFEFSGAWGFGAIVALIHDVVIAAGAVVLAHQLGFPILINLNIVAALLTIIGYSVNDTIVVFDRIREVKAAHPTRSYEDIVNEAINATLSRTILTSVTVLLADICLLIFGGPTIQDMAFTLLIGFGVGTYSSIFIASPLMIWWYRRFGHGSGQASVAAKLPRGGEPAGARV